MTLPTSPTQPPDECFCVKKSTGSRVPTGANWSRETCPAILRPHQRLQTWQRFHGSTRQSHNKLHLEAALPNFSVSSEILPRGVVTPEIARLGLLAPELEQELQLSTLGHHILATDRDASSDQRLQIVLTITGRDGP